MAGRRLVIAALVLPLTAAACKKDGNDPAAATIASAEMGDDAPVVVLSKTAKLASTSMHTNVYAKPSDTAKKIGYLRLGAIVPRSDKSYGTEGCPGGWYGIAPRGFVCVGKNATLNIDEPVVRAASRRPDTSKPLPYAYGFVRSVSPLYLRLPTREEQAKAEYKLANHLRWFENHRAEEQTAAKGANDFAHELIPDAPEVPPSDEQPDGILLGGVTNADPPPFWIENGNRGIPNVSGFEVPKTSYFANRVKRHTGLAFIGTFDAGPNLDHRRFAITVDLRLVPIDRVKPETASPFHGVELTGTDIKLPVAFAKPCDPAAKGPPKPCRRAFREEEGKLVNMERLLAPRAFLELTGHRRTINGTVFLESKHGIWVRQRDVGLAVVPHQWPQAAERGDKWVDVSVEDNTLILWEGKKPVFVTAVTTGQDGLGDPQTTKSTVRGLFRIKSKHITATMDSNGRSAESGGAMPDPRAGESPTGQDKRGSGAFELRDVPYVQYFHDGFAIHSAYWHDQFGLARSHGCINLSPIDAMRVFRFTEPQVPEGWHGVQAEGKGTIVIVHR